MNEQIKQKQGWFRRFLFPRLSTWFLIRVLLLTVGTWFVATRVVRPMAVDGQSMEPTYGEHGFLLSLLTAYRSHPPARGDVVTIRYGGNRFQLLKRVIAFEGETVEFRNGKCYVNGQLLNEPYVVKSCDWNVPPLMVAPGCIYAIGDNRSVPFEEHAGGEMARSRVAGRALW